MKNGTRTAPVPKPAVKPWLRRVETTNGVALEFAHATHVFEGEAARYVLPVVIPLLDGSRTVEDVVAYVGSEFEELVRRAIDALVENGLIVELPPDWGELPGSARQAIEYLSATGRGAAQPSEIAEALRSRPVGVVGSSPLAARLNETFAASGVERVGRLDWSDEPAAGAFVVAAPAADEVELLEGWNERALRERIEWMPVLPHNGVFASVGPVLIPEETCCYRCLQLRRAANLDYGEIFWALAKAKAPYPMSPGGELLLAGMCAEVVLRWIALRDPGLPGTFYAVGHGSRLELESHRVYRVPRCPVCSEIAVTGAPLPWHHGDAAEAGARGE
jgi:bacteriocin biosynthesis cyclodehydratase domain-containing protein